MTINRTTLLDLPLPVTGTESGVWGDVVNNGLSQYIDISVAGSLSLSADSDTNLSSTEGDASATNIGSTTAQYAILRCTGARTATRNINAPAWAISGGTLTNYSKIYIVVNETTGSQNIVLRATNSATPTYTTGVTIVPGERAVCAWNGSDFVKVGGAAGGSTTQVQYNNAGVLAGSSNLTFDGTNLTVGGTATATKLIPTGNVTAGNGMYLPTTNTLAFSTDGSERMRIDASGNVGIGETSPGTRLDVKGNGVPLTINSANSNGNKVQFEDNGTVKAYFGTTSFGGVVDCCFQASDSSGNTRFSVVAASGTIGLNTQPATTGTGITFPATQSASTDANTLDDYEEGTWTPSLGGNTTYSNQTGTYTKIGRQVTVKCRLAVSSIGTGSTRTISGLPFTPGENASSTAPYFDTVSTNIVYLTFLTNSTTLDAYSATAATGTLTGAANPIFKNGTTVEFYCTYFV